MKNKKTWVIIASFVILSQITIVFATIKNKNLTQNISGATQTTKATKKIENKSIYKSSNISTIEQLNNNLSAEAYIVIDAKTGQKIIGKNENEKKYPASLTKILTSLLLIENKKMDNMMTVSKAASNVGETSIGVKENEILSSKDVLNAMMIYSANDAAYVAGENIGGTIENFAKMMNERAQKAGAKNSNFVTPNGLHNIKHYSTAMDLALITKDALKYPEFIKTIGTIKYKLTRKSPNSMTTIKTWNRMQIKENPYYNPLTIGGKTGYTTPAGNCLMEVIKSNDIELIVVTLKSSQVYPDTNKIINFTLSNFNMMPLMNKDNVTFNYENTVLKLYSKEGVTYLSQKNATKKIDVKTEIKIDKNIKYPIKKDSKVAIENIYVDNVLYKSIDLYSSQNYDFSKPAIPSIIKNLLICSGILIFIKIIINIFKRNRIKRKKCLKNSDFY